MEILSGLLSKTDRNKTAADIWSQSSGFSLPVQQQGRLRWNLVLVQYFLEIGWLFENTDGDGRRKLLRLFYHSYR